MAFMPSYPTTIVYPTLETESIGNLFNSLFSSLKMLLIGCEIIAIDGTKAERTTKKANFNQKKIERHFSVY
jgi:hypothetical protein